MTMKWHDDFSTLLELCEWLDAECMMFPETIGALDMLRKPLRWYREYDAWQLWCEIPSCCERARDEVVDAVIDGRAIDSDFVDSIRKRYKRELLGSRHHSFTTRVFNLVFGCTEPEENEHE